MSNTLVLRPGHVTLAQWRQVYRGAPLALDPAALPVVRASAAAVAAIVAKGAPVYGINTGFGKLASVRVEREDLATLQRNIVLSHAAGVGEPMPASVVRLMMALKLVSLAQVHRASAKPCCCSKGCWSRAYCPWCRHKARWVPRVTWRRSHLASVMLGVGEAFIGDERLPAVDALARAGLQPIELGAKEGLALLNGTQFSTAYALAGLFEIETVFQAALVAGALSVEAAKGSDTPFDPRIHAIRGQRGQIATAATLRALMHGSEIRESHRDNDVRVQDPYCLRCQPQVMGAALDILRQAATTLEIEANGVSDNPLVFTDTGEALSGGNFHAEPVAFAADMLAMAVCEIGSISERRLAMLVDPALSGLPAFLTPRPGLNSGFMIPQVTAAALVSENKQRAYPASVDSIPTSANQEDHVSMAAHGARRLMQMAENAANVIGIELLAAAQGCDFHAPLRSSAALEIVRATLRAQVPTLEEDRYFHPDMVTATNLVRSGALAQGLTDLLPTVEPQA